MGKGLERNWKGDNLKSNWHGRMPRKSFQVDIKLDPYYEKNPTSPNPVVTLQDKKGWSAGQRFTIRNGSLNFAKSTIKFDMIFDHGHTPETFSGILVKDSTGMDYKSIQGTIKVHPIWLVGKPANVHSIYGRYHATVTLS